MSDPVRDRIVTHDQGNDIIAKLQAIATALTNGFSNYLPLSGGTLTGALAGTDAEFSGDVTSGRVSAAMADINNTNKAPINTLQRSTEYAVGDVLYTSELHAKFFLKCTTAGTTDDTAPDFTGVGSGDTVTDGTAEFTVQTILSLEEKEAAFVDDLIAALQTTGSLPTGTAFSGATLLSKMIANMNTQDGVQYNFSNANAWYICLGAKYGGLIIQGGTITSSNSSVDSQITFPVAFSRFGTLVASRAGNNSGDKNVIIYIVRSNTLSTGGISLTDAKRDPYNWIGFGV